jgi:hypothetical protein
MIDIDLSSDRGTREYLAIAAHYAGRHAARSRVPYLVHIDEGLLVLHAIGATPRARRAFCLHPLVQTDEDLAATWPRLAELSDDRRVLGLALEYRLIANATLSTTSPGIVRDPDNIAAIPLGPLVDVHDMLRADKVQTYKDFLRYHSTSHPQAAALDAYFRAWLARLSIDDRELVRLFAVIERGNVTP